MATTRRQFLRDIGLATAALALPAPALADDGFVTERLELALPGLHPGHDGIRIAQLSDIHVGAHTPEPLILAALEAARRFEPDLVFLTGDFVTRHDHEVGRAREILGGLPGPTFAVLGNHDHWVDGPATAAALRANGYEVLENAWTRVTVRGEPLAIVGVDDLLTRNADVPRAVKGLDEPAALVLAHGPRTADQLRHVGRPMACFSGHTHGGQIAVPIFTTLAFRLVKHEPYLRGRFGLGDVQLYVNRGLGLTSSFRLDSPPEVTLVTLRAASAR
ncbi:MAG TPA: metallophosphoesterase [Anaeromyxobacteraceae bacterium]|nr:metallophosphoesterase [Anaeromyxobacteraceae bacterium]